MQLQFLGATHTVTGSKYLVKLNNKNILIDCGLFQGLKELRLRNWGPFPIPPHLIDSVVLTHAHIDHSGYLPLLVKNGFNGMIYCSKATHDLCKILLPDSAHLQEEEARHANRHLTSKHKPALPLYTVEDAQKALENFYPLPFNTDFSITKDTLINLHPVGHILGASFVVLKHEGVSILFSGDVGRFNDPIMKAPSPMVDADYIVLESTYGNRSHDIEDPLDELEAVVNSTLKKGGTVLIPAFAVGRAQLVLYLLYQLKKQKRIPEIPIYLDSPMAINATELFYHYANEHRLDKETARQICDMAIYTNTQDESKALNANTFPKIIISASGMATGGRVLHHLIQLAPDPKNSIIFAGYQSIGTRGDAMTHGKHMIKIFGQMIPVNAKVRVLDNLSAHADYQELLKWLEGLRKAPKKIFLTHGEEKSAFALKEKIEHKFGWECVVPKYLQIEDLE